MARSAQGSRRRFRRRGPSRDKPAGHRGGPALLWSAVIAVGLVLLALPILLFNQQHSGDRLKIHRELRKF